MMIIWLPNGHNNQTKSEGKWLNSLNRTQDERPIGTLDSELPNSSIDSFEANNTTLCFTPFEFRGNSTVCDWGAKIRFEVMRVISLIKRFIKLSCWVCNVRMSRLPLEYYPLDYMQTHENTHFERDWPVFWGYYRNKAEICLQWLAG